MSAMEQQSNLLFIANQKTSEPSSDWVLARPNLN